MKFTYNIKDELVNAVGAKLGNPDNPSEAIEKYFQEIANNLMSDVIETHDEEVLQIKQQLESKIQEKKADIKNAEIRAESEVRKMKKIIFLLLLLSSFLSDAQIDKKKMFYLLNASADETPWYLAGGIPESTNYTIYDPLAATSLATSYVNLANPGVRNATAPVAAPTHAQGSGWTFNGTTQYLNTNTKATAAGTVIAWVEPTSSGLVTGTYIFGASVFTPTRVFFVRPSSSGAHQFQKGPSVTGIGLETHGAIYAISSTKCFINGISESTITAWSGADHTIDFFLGCQNSGGAANFAAYRLLRFAWYPSGLTDEQVKLVSEHMLNYNKGAINSTYLSSLKSLTPIFLYPCNEATGTVLLDHSGNNYHAEAYRCTTGHPALLGNGFKNNGDPIHTGRPNYKFIIDQPLNFNEFSFSIIVRTTGSNIPAQVNQIRLFETHHANTVNSPSGDYYAAEVRANNIIQIFFKEDGVQQNINTGIALNADTDYHIVFYNSLSNGVFGFYLNGVKYEYSKTSIIGFTGTLQPGYPYLNDESDFIANYIALYDYVITQEQVDSINPIN